MQIPTEAVEQECLFRWAAYASGTRPELKMLFHVPNEGKRSKITGAKMKKQGLRRGVPDIILPVARGCFHGLFIELKRTRGGKVQPEQQKWIEDLLEQGYAAKVCKGWEDARETIEGYLAMI